VTYGRRSTRKNSQKMKKRTSKSHKLSENKFFVTKNYARATENKVIEKT
jgi:hypothetical protein